MPTCVFWANASIAIGGGHLVRCLALAERLVQCGWTVQLATTSHGRELFPDLANRFTGGVLWLPGGVNDADVIVDRFHGADVCLVDSYDVGVVQQQQLRRGFSTIVAIDDGPFRTHDCDILVDQTLGRTPEEYVSRVAAGTVLLCGSGFAMLRRPFSELRARGTLHRRDGRQPRVLVSFGLTDPFNATGRALDFLSGLNCAIDVVIGSRAPMRPEVVRRSLAMGSQVRLHSELDAAGMADILSQVDLAIGAPGSSAYERCCLGVPSVLLLVAENQRANATALVAAGAAVDVGDVSSVDLPAARSTVAQLLSDRGRRLEIARAAERICDGQGPARIASAITARLRG